MGATPSHRSLSNRCRTLTSCETRSTCFSTKLDLAMAYMQFRIRVEDQYKTSFRVPGGQYKFRVGAFGSHGMSSVLMRNMLRQSLPGLRLCRPRLASGLPVRPAGSFQPMLGSFCAGVLQRFPHISQDPQEHLVHVRIVLETLQHYKLHAKTSRCQFCCSSVGFLGRIISEHDVAVTTPSTLARFLRSGPRPLAY